MSINIETINYNDFKNICRTCLINSELKSIHQDNIIQEILHNLTGIPFETNDDLPQQLCLKCFEKINEIHTFSIKCKQTYFELTECLNNTKNLRLNVKQELLEIEPEITIEEHKIDFIKEEEEEEESKIEFVTVTNSYELKIKEETPLISEHRCEVCTKTFPNIKSYKRHKKNVHSGDHQPYECNECSTKYTPINLIKNKPCIHCGKRPFVCEICNKAFTAARTLKTHKRKHSGELPYECDVCNRAFNCPGVLRNHKLTHSDERPFQCDACTKSFKFLEVLRRHKRTHSGECPYECNLCQKTFKNSSNLIRHKRIHSGERPHACDVCEKSFIDSAKLKKHKVLHEAKTTII